MNPEDVINMNSTPQDPVGRLNEMQVILLLSQLSHATSTQSSQIGTMSAKIDQILANHGKDLTELKEARVNNARTISMLIAVGVFVLGCCGWWIDKMFTKFEIISESVIRLEQRVDTLEKLEYESSHNK